MTISSDDYKVIYRGSKTSGITVAEDNYRRNLYLDGGILQSTMLLNDPNGLDLEYSQAMMCALLFQPSPKSILLVGLGGGSLVKFLLEYCPDARIDVAEINPKVVQIARQYFLLPECEQLRIISSPGEKVVVDRLAAGDSYDLILLDAFDDNGPARALLEYDFLCNCKSLLDKKGVFAMNLWKRPTDNFPSIYCTLSKLFEQHIHKLFLDDAYSNAIVFGFKEPLQIKNMMELKEASLELGRRTGVNFIRWLRQMHWQNT